VRALTSGLLGFAGIGPVRTTYLGMAKAATEARRAAWLEAMHRLGSRAR